MTRMTKARLICQTADIQGSKNQLSRMLTLAETSSVPITVHRAHRFWGRCAAIAATRGRQVTGSPLGHPSAAKKAHFLDTAVGTGQKATKRAQHETATADVH